MANVYDYPAVANLRYQAAAMRAALIAILAPTAAEGHTGETTPEDAATAAAINSAKWYDPTNHDLAHYIAQAAQSIGIDAVVKAAGYPDDAIIGICNMLNGQKTAASTLGRDWTYTADFGYDDGNQAETSDRYKRSKMVYALLPETRPSGSLANLFRESVSILELDPQIASHPTLGWQQVTSLNRAFNLSSVLPIMAFTEDNPLDIPLCTNIAYFGGNFCEISFKNARRVSSITQFAFSNAFLKAIRNWNLANVISASQPLPSKPVLETITFDGLTINNNGTATWAGGDDYHCDADDATAVNYIRNGMVMGKATAGGTSNINRSTALNAETLLALIYMAYDWGTPQDPHNPLGLTRRTEDADAMLTYNFTTAQKEALAAAYPDIDVAAIMAAKGWTY